MIPLTLCLLAPLGSIISTYLAAAMMWLYGVAGPLAIALLIGNRDESQRIRYPEEEIVVG